MTSYDFQPPMNMNAIRSSIVQRIKQRNVEKTCLDNGLPSPPIDTFESTKLPTDQVMNALYELSSDDKPLSPVSTTSTSTSSSSSSSSSSSEELDKESIRQRIKLLQEEKHKLFQMMKDLLNNKPNLQRSRSMSHTEHPPHTRPISRYNNTTTTSNLCTFPSTNHHHTRRYIASRPPIRSNSYSYSSFRTMNRYNSRH
ncbi:hypothetical protein G6F46_008885 [Rhizopus delemar]|nr:hypothetical protein G6F55_010436 [Rhizopus delemar]KAG1536206.1 hypothetical protein G6F51_011094 [Rhizopus arrhizus]KAG1594312.1 hypothetical protein G6F47_008838 [Rhizopus delemar]KAG1611932.1 hypothetical protein G6F46_008885 [Rhizopus delemar]KAG1623603.1 hypothetical protein G6F45_010820 [Rhizopus arrhizus]